MIIMAASRLRVSDVLDQLDYNGFPFWKSLPRSSFPLGEYGIQRSLFRFPQASRKPLQQSTHIPSPDKTERIRAFSAILHWITSYQTMLSVVFCNRRCFEHRVEDPDENF